MNVFYSWQADTPDKIGKSFIRLAIDDAVSVLTESLDLSEAERPIVDQDTQGVMGSPGIVDTIFKKIRNSDVVIFDATIVGETSRGKKLINSNVAYELGYSHGYHGDKVLLPVMNTHYGLPESLPFDLQHRRWPIRFDLSPESTKEQRTKVKKKLAKELSEIFKLYLKNRQPKKQYEQIQSTLNFATYWGEKEKIVQRSSLDEDTKDLMLGYRKDQSLVYLRIWPDSQLPVLSGSEINDNNLTMIEPLLGRAGGFSGCRNKYGYISFSGENADRLISTTQVFKNREIWGVEGFILRRRKDRPFGFVPTGVFEEGLIRSLKSYLNVAYNKLDYPDLVHIEAGMVNINGYKLAMPNNYWDPYWGEIFEDISVKTSVNKNDPDSINIALLKIFEIVFDSAGHVRPDNLGGFPEKE